MIKPKKTIQNIESYGVEQFAQPWLMKLDANENYLGPSPKVLEKIKNIETKDICQYPAYGNLYEKIAGLNNLDKENIAITNGADEALSAVINTYITSSSSVITVKPSFSMPKIYTGIAGAEYREIPYTEKWKFPEIDFIKNIDDTVKIILITSPNNPTGDIVEPEFIERLLNLYKDKLVVVDETYSTYAERTCASLVKRYDNIAVIRSLSKDYALAGLRIGYVLSDKVNISHIKKLLSPYTVNSIASIAATEAISDTKYIEFVKNEIKKSKLYLIDALTRFGAKVYESHTNFLLADFGSKSQIIYALLKSSNVIVKNFSDPLLSTCLRITVPSCLGAQKIVQLINPRNSIVFDMDGVLVDVSNSYRTAIQKTFEKYVNKHLELSTIQEAKNLGGLNNDWDLTQFLISREGVEVSYGEVVETFQQIYWNEGKGAINNETLLIDEQILKKLCEQYSLAIFTGRPRLEALYTLKKFGLDQYFAKIITMDDLPDERQKPDTLGLELIKNEFSCKNIFYLGDTVDDVKCAEKFGAVGIGVLPPSDKSDGLKDLLYVYGAKYVINDVNELENILEKADENR